MYTDYFKLSEPPFSLTPDPRYLFMSERHREGLAHLFFGVQQPGGFVQLTGDIGSGKTTLCRCLVKQLPPETDVALILNPRLTVIELLATVCDELGVPYPAETTSNKILIDALNQRLLESHAKHRRTVLIIDEAQNLNEEVLEQIRLLTNLETSKEKLLQVILIGQPELLSVLKEEKLRQLAQRITARYHLLPLSKSETYSYIQHRLRIAGTSDPLFTSLAMSSIYRLSRGIPRIINIICDRALLGAYALDKRQVGPGIVRRASREARGVIPWRRRYPFAWISAILVLSALMIGGAIFLAPSKFSIFHRGSGSQAGNSAQTLPKKTTQAASPEVAKPLIAEASPHQRKGPPIVLAKVQANSELADLLVNASSPGVTDSSFNTLFRQWGASVTLRPSDLGCKVALTQGFECLFQSGGWPKLRRYDLPAILELLMPDGTRRRATLVGLADKTATLAIGKEEYEVPLEEVNRMWDGAYILLWKPPFASRRLKPGDSGKEVLWVRRALDVFEGKASSPDDSELFDEGLKQRVIAFQRRQSLIQDGCVGGDTLVQLALLARQGSGAPSISRRTRS
jgi:general secretion pathway protein A